MMASADDGYVPSFAATRELDRPWRIAGIVLLSSAALFHLWFVGVIGTLPERLLNSAHLAFMLTAAFLLFPALRSRSPQTRPSVIDLGLIALTLVVTLYIAFNQIELDERIESVTPISETQIVLGTIALLILLEATRRVIGTGMTVILATAIGYLLLGSSLPGQLGFRNISYQRCIELMYLGSDGGMFGQLTGISANELILFILFGAFLSRTGIGEWFGELSAAIGGNWVGGSAKIAVMYSALFGGVAGRPHRRPLRDRRLHDPANETHRVRRQLRGRSRRRQGGPLADHAAADGCFHLHHGRAARAQLCQHRGGRHRAGLAVLSRQGLGGAFPGQARRGRFAAARGNPPTATGAEGGALPDPGDRADRVALQRLFADPLGAVRADRDLHHQLHQPHDPPDATALCEYVGGRGRGRRSSSRYLALQRGSLSAC